MKALVALAALAPALLLAAPSFSDPSFESINVAPGQFVQAPANPNWGFTNVENFASGVANGASSWGSSAAQGVKYAYLQRNSQINQTITGMVPGQAYEIRFGMSRRDGSVGGNDPNRLALQFNGVTQNEHSTINDAIWRTFRSPVFVASGASMNVRWQGLINDADRTSLLDNISIVAATPRVGYLTDGDFETVPFGPGGWAYNPAWVVGSDWRFGTLGNNIGAGIASVGSPWGQSAANGTRFGFVQSTGVLSQQLHNLVVGRRYWLTFDHNRRTGFGAHNLRVTANGTQILGTTASPSNWTARTTGSFVATSSRMTIAFEGQSANDVSSLIDNVQVVPEPGSLAILALGAAALMRRRKR